MLKGLLRVFFGGTPRARTPVGLVQFLPPPEASAAADDATGA